MSLNSLNEIPPGYLAPGNIIFLEDRFVNRDVDHEGDLLFSISSENLEPQPFLQNLLYDWVGDYYVSPENQWLAIQRHVTNGDVIFYDLVLTTSDTNDLLFLPWNEDMSGGWDIRMTKILSWTGDNQYLLLGRSAYAFEEVVIYSPFTNEKEVIFPNPYYLGDVSNPSGLQKWEGGVNVVYSPDMTMVICTDGISVGEFILFDLELNLEVRRFYEAPLISLWSKPAWSPDSRYFAIADWFDEKEYPEEEDPYQVVILDRNGEEFWRSETLADYPDISNILLRFDWSPNSRYFMYYVGNPDNGEIYTRVLDIETGEVKQYPFWGFYYTWSPDRSQYIMLDQKINPDTHGREYLGINIIDIQIMEVLHIENSSYKPIAWLTVDE